MSKTEIPPIAIDLDGGTDIGADIVDADLFLIDDGAGGTMRKTAASRVKTYVGGFDVSSITGATELSATPQKTDEFVMSDDASMSAAAMSNLFIDHMDTAFEKWTPRKRFTMFKA